jgi:hypothetical protein
MKHHAGGGAIYGLGVIGALIYSIQHASSLADGLIGFVYSVFWPAVFVYKVLEMWKF